MACRACCAAVAFAWLTSAAALACEPEAALAELEQGVLGPLDADERDKALSILEQHCAKVPGPAAGTSRDSAVAEANTSGQGAAEQSAAEEEPARLFGIEFRKADPDAKGHDRLKKRP